MARALESDDKGVDGQVEGPLPNTCSNTSSVGQSSAGLVSGEHMDIQDENGFLPGSAGCECSKGLLLPWPVKELTCWSPWRMTWWGLR